MPLQATSGAASYDAFGGGVPVVPTFIEEVFSTYLYDGSNSATTITNGIDLSTKGGLVWTKCRSSSQGNHLLIDTVRGVNKPLRSNETGAEYTETTVTAFNANGYNIAGGNGDISLAGRTYVGWTFREQPKFFDIVTYTGNSTARTIAHNLGSVPGCIIIKGTTGPASTQNWAVYHRSTGNTQALFLDLTQAPDVATNYWNDTTPTSTVFSLGAGASVNNNTTTYVAYLFAHDAGGFGLTGTDNVISCGSLTADGSGNSTVTLGYEPQWIIAKPSSEAGSWRIYDNMRGMNLTRTLFLNANNSDAEGDSNAGFLPNATGFTTNAQLTNPSATYIYIAIRRGPMKVPTSGTSVFNPDLANASVAPLWEASFPVDLGMYAKRDSTTATFYAGTRLTGTGRLSTWATTAEVTDSGFKWDYMNGWFNNAFTDSQYLGYSFKRAPSFFDEVCYLGNGGYVSRNHNLAAVPEMMIVKARSTTSNWSVYHSALGFENYVRLNTTAASAGTGDFWYLTPTATQFSTGGYADIDDTGVTYVAYLFATCAGVSKVGSYTGNGSSQTINCGFTGGARFVLIKKSSGTGDWMVSDSARGIVSGNDPYLELNNTNAEVTGEDWLDTNSTGFVVNEVSGSNANTNGATYIFLAIA
jgi:hypothetical protein